MGTNCAPLLADIFSTHMEQNLYRLCSQPAENSWHLNFTYTCRYIDNVLSINKPDFQKYLGQINPVELKIKDTTQNNTSASYLYLILSIGMDGKLHTSIYDKHCVFNLHLTNFPLLNNYIPASPAYGVFISQLIRYTGPCSSYECFIPRTTRLSNKILEQGHVKERLKSPLKKFMVDTGILASNTKFLSHEC